MGLLNVTILRSPIIGWRSMADVKNVTGRKRQGGERVKEWNSPVDDRKNRPRLLEKKSFS
jgi:hypothetical protein